MSATGFKYKIKRDHWNWKYS